MTNLTEIPFFYCAFALNCFTLNEESLTKIKDHNSNEVEYFPLCKSYRAQPVPFMKDVNTYSMICTDNDNPMVGMNANAANSN